MVQASDLTLETGSVTGTGDVTLAAFPYYRRFSNEFATGADNKFYYCIRHRAADEWEVGVGYLSATSTLVRERVLRSSNANALVSFTAGDKDVISDIPAAYQSEGSLNRTNPSMRMLTGGI